MKTPVLSPLATLGLAAIMLAVGCATTKEQVNTVEPANPAYVRRNIEDKRVVRDSETARAVAILNVIEGNTPDGLTRIGVEIQNQRRKTFRFNYRFDWFDPQGFPVNTPATTMVSQQIEGGQMMILDGVSPHPEARDFRLTIQESTRAYFPRLRSN